VASLWSRGAGAAGPQADEWDLQWPPTVAVLKGVVADGTPHCGSAVLTTTVAAVAPARQIELIPCRVDDVSVRCARRVHR